MTKEQLELPIFKKLKESGVTTVTKEQLESVMGPYIVDVPHKPIEKIQIGTAVSASSYNVESLVLHCNSPSDQKTPVKTENLEYLLLLSVFPLVDPIGNHAFNIARDYLTDQAPYGFCFHDLKLQILKEPELYQTLTIRISSPAPHPFLSHYFPGSKIQRKTICITNC